MTSRYGCRLSPMATHSHATVRHPAPTNIGTSASESPRATPVVKDGDGPDAEVVENVHESGEKTAQRGEDAGERQRTHERKSGLTRSNRIQHAHDHGGGNHGQTEKRDQARLSQHPE